MITLTPEDRAAASNAIAQAAVEIETGDTGDDDWLANHFASHRAASIAPLVEARPDVLEAMARAHCDFFGGEGWWDTGLIADTRPKALEAMKLALAAALQSLGEQGK